MQQITNTHAAKVKSPVLSLAISWLIILGTYFLLRLIFIVFGFHLYAGLLGGCLAFVPYLISTIYLYKSTRTTNIWIYLLGIAFCQTLQRKSSCILWEHFSMAQILRMLAVPCKELRQTNLIPISSLIRRHPIYSVYHSLVGHILQAVLQSVHC